MSSTGVMKTTGVFVERREGKDFVQRTTEGPSNFDLPTKGPRERLEDISPCVILHTAVSRCEAVLLWSSVSVPPFSSLLLVLLLAPSCQSEPELHIHLSIIPLHLLCIWRTRIMTRINGVHK